MAKLKTFEQFVTEMDRAEEIEKDIVDQGTPEEHAEDDADKVQSPEQQANEAEDVVGTEADKLNGKTKDVSGKIEFDDKAVNTDTQDLGKEVEKEIKDTPEDDKIGKEVNEEVEEEAEGEEETAPAPKTVAEMLKESCDKMKEEAKVWEEDEHDEHTIETYMNENAALIGSFVANTLKEMKEDYAMEAYEAACNSMKESFCKKVDEIKEANSTPGSMAQSED
jgi:hypothetical protein